MVVLAAGRKFSFSQQKCALRQADAIARGMESHAAETAGAERVQIVRRREKSRVAENYFAEFGVRPSADESQDPSKILETRSAVGGSFPDSLAGLGRQKLSALAGFRPIDSQDEPIGRRETSRRSLSHGIASKRSPAGALSLSSRATSTRDDQRERNSAKSETLLCASELCEKRGGVVPDDGNFRSNNEEISRVARLSGCSPRRWSSRWPSSRCSP